MGRGTFARWRLKPINAPVQRTALLAKSVSLVLTVQSVLDAGVAVKTLNVSFATNAQIVFVHSIVTLAKIAKIAQNVLSVWVALIAGLGSVAKIVITAQTVTYARIVKSVMIVSSVSIALIAEIVMG
jgi:hypothetical protein